MTISDQIIQSVSMLDVVERYGFELNKKSLMCCPFHNEKTASFRVYPGNRGFYCFGCTTGGNVITFVSKYFELDNKDAISKLNEDFNLGLLTIDYRTRKKNAQASREAIIKRSKEKKLKKEYNAIYDRVNAYFRQCWFRLKECLRPSETFFLLLRRIDYMNYWLSANKTFELWEANR